MDKKLYELSGIVAITENNVIGNGERQIYYLQKDLQYFKNKTLGYPVIMGRKTYQSIGRALPGRTNIILTRNLEFRAPHVLVMHDLESVLEKISLSEKAFVIGGGEIYRLLMPYIDKLYITKILTTAEKNITFPNYEKDFKIISESEVFHENDINFKFTYWERED